VTENRCPWCGGNAVLSVYQGNWYRAKCVDVSCAAFGPAKATSEKALAAFCRPPAPVPGPVQTALVLEAAIEEGSRVEIEREMEEDK